MRSHFAMELGSLNSYQSWFSDPSTRLMLAFEEEFPASNGSGDPFCKAFVLVEAYPIRRAFICSCAIGGGDPVAST